MNEDKKDLIVGDAILRPETEETTVENAGNALVRSETEETTAENVGNALVRSETDETTDENVGNALVRSETEDPVTEISDFQEDPDPESEAPVAEISDFQEDPDPESEEPVTEISDFQEDPVSIKPTIEINPKPKSKPFKLEFMNKKNLMWILVLIVLIFVFWLSKGRENIEKRTELFRFSSADVTRIEFIQPADTLIVAFEQGSWRILHPEDAPVNTTQRERFFENYLGLTISRTAVSESIERQGFYNVDEETALQISLYGRNNRLLSKVFYGRNPNTYSIAYIRRDNDNKIYQVENIIHFISPSFPAWQGEEEVIEDENLFEFGDWGDIEFMVDE